MRSSSARYADPSPQFWADAVLQAKFLRYLDLSENTIDKRSAEYLVQALTSSHYPDSAAPTPALSPAVAASPSAHLATPHPLPTPPAHEAPQSSLHSMSGLGITDEDDETSHGLQRVSSIDSDASYLDDESEPEESEPLFLDAPLLREGLGRENGMVLSIRLENCGLKGQALEALGMSGLPRVGSADGLASSRCAGVHTEAHLDAQESDHGPGRGLACDHDSRLPRRLGSLARPDQRSDGDGAVRLPVPDAAADERPV